MAKETKAKHPGCLIRLVDVPTNKNRRTLRYADSISGVVFEYNRGAYHVDIDTAKRLMSGKNPATNAPYFEVADLGAPETMPDWAQRAVAEARGLSEARTQRRDGGDMDTAMLGRARATGRSDVRA